jgi:hypothetical protein
MQDDRIDRSRQAAKAARENAMTAAIPNSGIKSLIPGITWRAKSRCWAWKQIRKSAYGVIMPTGPKSERRSADGITSWPALAESFRALFDYVESARLYKAAEP